MMRFMAAMMAAGMLAGCSDTPRVVASQPSAAYSINEASYAASGRDFRVTIAGNPFGGDGEAFARRVTAAMQRRIPGVVTNFTTTPGDSARPGYRVALAFNPPINLTDSELCGSQPVPAAAPSPTGPMIVMGAFCRGGPLTYATGWLDAPKGADDPAFDALVGHLTTALFPTHREKGCLFPDC
ncbi:hypothetical protein M2352_003533 [Azospirillum fermentarium]|uniref:hypothetical protein n=1 Tax=Azospirillum fermentarium TaxID=1233114 RepID=UPI002226579A|nr:hypothetical protein [Azospirillum fermentarium]MCW2247899.1 hypothetical protein [Azospirillum fermentarium]